MIDLKALSALVQEANDLTSKSTLTKHEERRFAFLQTAIAAVKAGASLQDVQLAQLNEVEQRNGFRPTSLNEGTPAEVRAKALFMRTMFKVEDSREIRTETEGAPMLAQIGTYTSL